MMISISMVRDIFGIIYKYLPIDDKYSLIKAYPRQHYLQQYYYPKRLIRILTEANEEAIIKKIYKTQLRKYSVLLWAIKYGHYEIV